MRLNKVAAALALCFPAAASAQSLLQQEVFWPERGKFPAYPLEIEDHRWTFSAFGGIERDSNPFRLSDTADPQTVLGSTEKSDTVGRYGIGFRADLPASRQRFLVEADIAQNDYNRFDILDHTSHRAGVTWKWQAGDRWSGDIGYSNRRFLASLAELQAPIKDMVDENRAFASGGYMLTPRWKLRAAGDWLKWDHDEPTRQSLDAEIVSGTLGLDYVTPAQNFVGAQVKYSEGDYPNQQLVGATLVDNSYNETEGSIVVHWIPTGKSTFDARLGYTSRHHDQLAQRDFDGFTGRLGYDWFVGAKTLINFSAWREIRSTEDVSASYLLAEGWGIGPAWAPTSKLVFQARYVSEDRDYQGDPGIPLTGAPQREDTFRGIVASAGYAPRRNLQFLLAGQRGERESNVFGRDYDYTTVSANAKILF